MKQNLTVALNWIFYRQQRAWIPNVILFESKTISLTSELPGLLRIPKPAPCVKIFSTLGAGLGIPSEPCSSKLRLIVLLSNRMTSGIHAQKSEIPYSTKGKGKTWRDELKIHFWRKKYVQVPPQSLVALWKELDWNSVRTWKNMSRFYTWNWGGGRGIMMVSTPPSLQTAQYWQQLKKPQHKIQPSICHIYTIWNSYYGYVLVTYEQSIHAQCTFEIYSKIPKEHWNFPNYHFCILNYDGGKDHNVVCNACIHIFY